MKWTPLQIEVLLAIKCGTFSRNNNQMHRSRAAEEAIRLFENHKMVEYQPDPSDVVITPKGEAFVEKILHTPIPLAKITWEFPE